MYCKVLSPDVLLRNILTATNMMKIKEFLLKLERERECVWNVEVEKKRVWNVEVKREGRLTEKIF